MPSEASSAGAPQRLHPSSLLFGIGAAARNLLLPGLAVLVFSRGSNYEAWFMLLFLPAAISYLAKYFSYRYRLGEDEMVIREGILTRNERHIPYARIQNIDVIQNPLHRLFDVAVARLETASGGKPEAVIRVLAMPAVEQMRERVFRDRQAGVAAVAREDGTVVAGATVEPAHSVLELPVKELVLFGLISNRGMVVVAAALGLASQTGLFNRDYGDWVERQIENASGIPDPGIGDKLFLIPLFILAAIVVLLVLMRILSVTWAIFKLYGFTLTRRGDDLRTVYGLLTRVSATIPRRRIQLLSIRVSRLHRMLRRASVQVETAGGSGGGDGGDEVQGPITERLWLAPLIRRDRVPRLLSEVLPELDAGDLDWQPVSPRARRRILRKGLVVLILLGAVSFAAFGEWGLVWLPLGWWLLWNHAKRWVATAAYALTNDSVIYRSGWWGQSTTVVRFGKIQVLELSETPFDRRNRMASVKVDTAGASRVGHRIAIPYLEIDVARSVLARLDTAASQTAFSW